MKELKGKIEDYTRFGQILLAVSIVNGWLVDSEWSKRDNPIFVMMGSIVIFLSLSFFFFQRVKVMRDQLEENECE